MRNRVSAHGAGSEVVIQPQRVQPRSIRDGKHRSSPERVDDYIPEQLVDLDVHPESPW